MHGASSTKVIPATWFNQYESLSSRFASAVGFGDKSAKKDVHAFTVLARILADPIFAPTKVADMYGFYKQTVETLGDPIRKYVDEWTLDGDLEQSLEQLIWVNTLIYGVGGAEEPTFNADFFQYVCAFAESESAADHQVFQDAPGHIFSISLQHIFSPQAKFPGVASAKFLCRLLGVVYWPRTSVS